MKPLRVVQWASGNVGRYALRAIDQHPELELVGLYVTNPDKVGRDAGDIARLHHTTGVVATDDVEQLLALGADAVCHTPLPSAQVGDDPDLDLRTICRLLAAGCNVVTTVGYVYPKAYGTDVVRRLQDACTAGGVSVHGTGVNPGFMADLVPLLLSGLMARIDGVYVRESSEFSQYPSPDIILGMMGFGLPPDRFEQHTARYRRWLTGLFAESVHLIADGVHRPVDEVVTDFEVVVADRDLELAAGPVAAGTVAGQRWVWTGQVGGSPFVVFEAVYRADPAVAPEWGPPGWALRMDGAPAVSLELEHWLTNGLLATAMHAVNAIPAVCAAEPGIRTFLDLPVIAGRAGVSPHAPARRG
jgi:hypothetical protein